MAPDDVNDNNSLKVFNTLYKDLLTGGEKKKPLFKKGDRVRVYVDKSLFEKGYMPNFKDDVCKIHQVIGHNPKPVYLVKSGRIVLPKKFYEEELSAVK
jgi:hypothetical protein